LPKSIGPLAIFASPLGVTAPTGRDGAVTQALNANVSTESSAKARIVDLLPVRR
jgi:hypothetical protein